jgi:EmrB/QacA subfamily drug resistance transporter
MHPQWVSSGHPICGFASAGMNTPSAPKASTGPKRAALVLGSLIVAATVANFNLAVANVALPTIGRAFDASQARLNLIAVGYTLGLAMSVLYLGAVGDRYGRKQMLLLGAAATVPLSCLAAYAPSSGVLIGARVLGGVAGGMCYPTTLSLIAALWHGSGRTRSIALWSGIGGAIAALGPLVSGALLQHFWWGSVFLVTAPIAVAAFALCWVFVPSHVEESSDAVDNLGGVLSVVVIGALVLAINFVAVPDSGGVVIGLTILVVAALIAFVVRERRARNPLYDLHTAARPTFWVAAVAGLIVFGAFMAALFIGQQYLQNVLGYSTVKAGASILPMAVMMVLVAPSSAKLTHAVGSRLTLVIGSVFILLGYLTMLLLWKESSHYGVVGLAYALVGVGVGLAQTPAAHALTASVPPTRVGMASATADLQRDLGGAVMQSILGVLLTVGYASSMTKLIGSSPQASQITNTTQTELTKSFSSAADTAQQYPQYASQITSAAKSAFLHGDQWAYTAGIVAVVIGGVVALLFFPNKRREAELMQAYARAGEEDDHDATVLTGTKPLA